MKEMSRFSYKIHYTGSKGNIASIYAGELGFLFDIGKAYKNIEPLLYDKQFIIVSHRHGDHIQWSTYKRIREFFPHIKVIANDEVNQQLIKRKLKPVDVVIHDDMQIMIGDVKITFLQNYHGDKQGDPENYAENHGMIMECKNEVLLFATDLSTTIDYQMYLDKHNLKVDYLLLENNYNPQVIEFYESSKNHTGYSIFSNGSYRHLPCTEHQMMIDKYLKKDGVYEELHQSETYSSFEGLIKRSEGKITMEDVRAWMG